VEEWLKDGENRGHLLSLLRSDWIKRCVDPADGPCTSCMECNILRARQYIHGVFSASVDLEKRFGVDLEKDGKYIIILAFISYNLMSVS
jgi:hypothetical protein